MQDKLESEEGRGWLLHFLSPQSTTWFASLTNCFLFVCLFVCLFFSFHPSFCLFPSPRARSQASFLFETRKKNWVIAMITWMIENKPKILNLFNFQKIQSLDFLINLHIASIAFMEVNVDCITKPRCSKFVLRLSLNRISAKFRQILKEYVGFKILSFIYNANKSQEKKAPSHCSLSTYAQHLRIHWGNLVCQNDKSNIK